MASYQLSLLFINMPCSTFWKPMLSLYIPPQQTALNQYVPPFHFKGFNLVLTMNWTYSTHIHTLRCARIEDGAKQKPAMHWPASFPRVLPPCSSHYHLHCVWWNHPPVTSGKLPWALLLSHAHQCLLKEEQYGIFFHFIITLFVFPEWEAWWGWRGWSEVFWQESSSSLLTRIRDQ